MPGTRSRRRWRGCTPVSPNVTVPVIVLTPESLRPRRHFEARAPGCRHLRRASRCWRSTNRAQLTRFGRAQRARRGRTFVAACGRRGAARRRVRQSTDRRDRDPPASRARGARVRRRAARSLTAILCGVEAWTPIAGCSAWRSTSAARLIAISRFTRDGFRQPIRRSPAALSTSATSASTRWRRCDATPRQPASALIVGRMAADERYKGHDSLLEIWRDVGAAVPGASLRIVGDGDDRLRLEEKAPRSSSAIALPSSAGSTTKRCCASTRLHRVRHAQPRRGFRVRFRRGDARVARLPRQPRRGRRDYRGRRNGIAGRCRSIVASC